MKLKPIVSLSLAAMMAVARSACGSAPSGSASTSSVTSSVAASDESSAKSGDATSTSVAGEYLSAEKIPFDVMTKGELPADVTVTLNEDGTAHVLIFIYEALQAQFDSTYTAQDTTVTVPVPDVCQGINRDTGEFEDNELYTEMVKGRLGDEMSIELDTEYDEFTLVE